MRRVLAICVLGVGFSLLGLPSRPASAQQRAAVVVTGSDVSMLKVALQHFAVDGASLDETTAAGFRAKVNAALEYSSLFKNIDPKAFLGSQKTTELTRSRSLRCSDWRAIGADLFIEGVLSEEPRRLVVEVQVWDVAQCKKIRGGSNRYRAGRMDTDLLAHHLVDELIELLTGRRGVSDTEIAFVSDRGGNREIFVMSADGSGERQATRNGSVNALPGWSPDGKSIFYVSYRSNRRPALYSVAQGGKKSGRVKGDLAPKDKVYRGVMSPNGKRLALVMPDDESNMGIYLTDAHGRGLKRITHTRGNSLSPTWSPDGKRIAFVSDRTGSPQLYIMDSNGKNISRLTFTGGYNSAPSWSPDGRWIVYELRVEGQFDIWLTDPTGKVNVPLITHRRSDEAPTWSPDSRKIAFSSNRRGRMDVYVVDLNGENLRRLTQSDGDSISPTWGPYKNR